MNYFIGKLFDQMLHKWLQATVVWAHAKAVITKLMSTTDGAINQNLFYDLK